MLLYIRWILASLAALWRLLRSSELRNLIVAVMLILAEIWHKVRPRK